LCARAGPSGCVLRRRRGPLAAGPPMRRSCRPRLRLSVFHAERWAPGPPHRILTSPQRQAPTSSTRVWQPSRWRDCCALGAGPAGLCLTPWSQRARRLRHIGLPLCPRLGYTLLPCRLPLHWAAVALDSPVGRSTVCGYAPQPHIAEPIGRAAWAPTRAGRGCTSSNCVACGRATSAHRVPLLIPNPHHLCTGKLCVILLVHTAASRTPLPTACVRCSNRACARGRPLVPRGTRLHALGSLLHACRWVAFDSTLYTPGAPLSAADLPLSTTAPAPRAPRCHNPACFPCTAAATAGNIGAGVRTSASLPHTHALVALGRLVDMPSFFISRIGRC
jgi:hypothetical protein